MEDIPNCANPGCTNKVHQRSHNSGYTTYCSVTCRNQHTAIKRALNGTCPFQSQNRPKTEDGKDIYMIKANKTKLDNGTHNFLRDNRPHDEYGRDIIVLKQKDTMLELYGTKSTSLGYLRDKDGNIIDCIENEERFSRFSKNSIELQNRLIKEGRSIWAYQRDKDGNILDNEHNKLVYEYHLNHAQETGWIKNIENSESGVMSSDIENKLYDQLVKNHKIIRQYKVPPYFIDYYLEDLDIFVECDGMYKWIWDNGVYKLKSPFQIRKNYVESVSKKKMINIPTIFIYPIISNLDEVDKLLFKLINSSTTIEKQS